MTEQTLGQRLRKMLSAASTDPYAVYRDKSLWDEYRFEPQPDITAYELALILRAFSWVGAAANLACAIYLRKDGSDFGDHPEMVQVKRHFRYVGPMQ